MTGIRRRWVIAIATVALTALAVLLAVVWRIGLLGEAPEERHARVPPAAQTIVEQYATGFARPDGFLAYWMEGAPELDPIEDADVIVAGTVAAVTAVKGIKPELDGRTPQDWLTRVDFDVVCPIKGLGSHTKRIRLSYVLSESQYMGGPGPSPHLLGPGVSYLLLLKRPGWGQRDFPFDPEGDPPPIPLATVDPGAGGAGTPEEIIVALMIASWRETDSDLREYALPVLGYLAHFHRQAQARAELMRAVRSEDAKDVQKGFRWLTEWGKADPELLALAEERSSDHDPRISAETLAVRIEADGTTALLGDVIAWLKRPDASDEAARPLAGALLQVHPTTANAELLHEYEELLAPGVPTRLRAQAVRQLAEIGTMEVAPLLSRVLEDSSPTIRLDAIEGLYKASQSPGAPDLEEHVPSPNQFRADPDQYTDFWRQWWETASQEGWPPGGEHGGGEMGPAQEPGMRPGPPPPMRPMAPQSG